MALNLPDTKFAIKVKKGARYLFLPFLFYLPKIEDLLYNKKKLKIKL
jgi:hypothetical protein